MRYITPFFALAACSFAALAGPDAEKRFPPLQIPPGFKATLFACDPLIEYPSVIAAGPRPGSIYVAFDYMTGLGSDGKVKSEVRLVQDTDNDGYADESELFAGGFNSIQGLAYSHGVVYVMHAPFLTAVRGKERKDLLTGLGLKPEENSSRLHCANGVVPAHDGWLYLAVGDHGIDVPRPEGDRLVYKGGGILRCRPDGRDLHVFSTGLRNIYDVALDAELNAFTRDNENDGGAYMIRVCHSFFGADHGYPYDYAERPDQALKPLGDFGLGSSAGGVCYLETQFPTPFRGNLFFGEWGKSVVRCELKRAGAGFAPVKEAEFAVGGPKDAYPFKPTDAIVQRDGTLMVSDYADGQRPKRGRGRIYHFSYVAAAAPKSTAKGLDADSYFERCETQAVLERDGQRPDFTKLGSFGRMHGVWILAHLDGPKATDALLRMAETDADVAVRCQAVRAIADLADPVLVSHKLGVERGDPKLAMRLAELGGKQDPRLVLEVVIALGRLRWADAPTWCQEHLDDPDPTLAHAAMHTLRRADNWPAVMKLLDEPASSAIRKIAVHAIADQYEPIVADDLVRRLGSAKEASQHPEIAELLARISKRPGPYKYWGYRPGPRPVHTEKWERTDSIELALNRWLREPNQKGRIAVLKRMQREKIPVRLESMVRWLKDEHQHDSVKVVLGALYEFPPADIRGPLIEALRDRHHSSENRIGMLDALIRISGEDAANWLADFSKSLEDGPVLAEAIRRLGNYPKLSSGPGLAAARLSSPAAAVRAAAIEALGQLQAESGREAALNLLNDEDVSVRRAAAAAAGKLGVQAAVEPLLKWIASPDPAMRLACLDSLKLLREPRVVPFAIQALETPTTETAAVECLAVFGGEPAIQAIVRYAKRRPSTDGLIAAIRSLSEDRSTVAEIQGTSGILVRWEVGAAFPGKENDVKFSDWTRYFAEGAESRLAFAPKKDAGPIRFARTFVSVAAETPVEFLASSRGGLEVWLNGQSLHRRAKPGKYATDSDRFAGTFPKGDSRILVAADAADGPVEFHLHFRRKSDKAEHEKLIQTALARTGNIERGRAVFFNKDKSQCLKCHQFEQPGERIGPDLTGVGGRFSRIHLIESILQPSRAIAPSFNTFLAVLTNGKTLTGVKLAETDATLTLADNQGMKHVLRRGDIEELQPLPTSTMPEGLEQRMTLDEFVDLIGFLASQKAVK